MQGSRGQVSLTSSASRRSELGELLGLLDALGDGLQAQRLRHLDDRTDERRVLGIEGGDPVHERLVDLQDVDREPLQVAER